MCCVPKANRTEYLENPLISSFIDVIHLLNSYQPLNFLHFVAAFLSVFVTTYGLILIDTDHTGDV